MQVALDRFSAGAASVLGRALERREIEMFGKYILLLQKWQRVHRLVGSVDPDWVVDNLFLDSLLFLKVVPQDAITVADLGSGAGFPGIPIKIVRPQTELSLIEARQRRASFLSAVSRELGLQGVRVLGGRAEDVGLTGLFDVVVMRCAGSVERVLRAARGLAAPGGRVIVSGPPTLHRLDQGEWFEVAGVRPGSIRRFAVYTP